MKKLVLICGVALMILSLPVAAQAQEDDDRSDPGKAWDGIKKGAKGVKKGVKKGAHEVAEQTVEIKADVTDKEVEGKIAPNGEDVYIDENDRYYYIDDKGHKIYINASQMRNEPRERDDD